jgi:putative endonuclease
MASPFIPIAEWRDPRHRLGVRGEHLAIGFLTAAGWRLEAHRFRLGRHDLDLVMRRRCLVAFVEVKTRTGSSFGAGVEAVGWRKRRTLARLAEVWRGRHGRPSDLYRFDLVEVRIVAGTTAEVIHVEDAWRVEGRW